MYIKFFLNAFFLLLIISITAQETIKLRDEKPTKSPEEKNEIIETRKLSIEDQLKYYFRSREIKPAIIINNINDSMLKNGEEIINISNHEIVWRHSSKETKIKIDDNYFSLKDQKTLNIVKDDKEEVDFANDWDQIKLFEFGDQKFIGISMINDPCTGIGCRVMFYLIYNLKTKNKSFFGTYRFLMDREFGLFDFGNDGTLDFLSGTYADSNDGKEVEFENIYQIFTLDDKGFFHLQTDDKGKSYFMKRFYKEDDYEEIDRKFEHYWTEEIK